MVYTQTLFNGDHFAVVREDDDLGVSLLDHEQFVLSGAGVSALYDGVSADRGDVLSAAVSQRQTGTAGLELHGERGIGWWRAGDQGAVAVKVAIVVGTHGVAPVDELDRKERPPTPRYQRADSHAVAILLLLLLRRCLLHRRRRVLIFIRRQVQTGVFLSMNASQVHLHAENSTRSAKYH